MKRLVLVCLLLATACAARHPSGGTPDLVLRAQVIGAQDRMAAIRMLESELAPGRADASLEPWALLWAGEQRRLANDLSRSRAWFVRLAQRYPTHPLKDAAVLGIALVDAETSLSGNTLATLQLMGDSRVPDTLNADRYRVLARVAADDGAPRHKVRMLVDKALRYSEVDSSVQVRVIVSLTDLIEEKQTTDGAPVEPGTPEEIALKRARAALAAAEFDKAKDLASDLLETWPDSSHALEAGYIVRRSQSSNPTHAGKVGVLLPLSGDFAPAATQLKAVIMAANKASGSLLELVFADTAGTTEQTTSESERLVIEEGVVAMLGPLLKANGEEAGIRAQGLRTPLVTLTQGGDPTRHGSFVFRGFMTLDHQVHALLDHAMGEGHHRTFAILHPNDGYGTAARDLFAAEVSRRGGTVTDIVSYETDTTDFRTAAQTLGDKLLEDRKEELSDLRREARRQDADENDVMLSPTIDFDALFIPDNHRRLSLVASALAYEEFPVGSFRAKEDDQPLQLLGLNSWNVPSLATTGGRYVYDSVFVDAFWTDTDAEPMASFVESFQADFSRPPGVTDALAWDATRLLTAAVLEGGDDRQAIRDALITVQIDDPVAGGHRFGDNREVDRTFHVLTIGEEGIIKWAPPPPAEPLELFLE